MAITKLPSATVLGVCTFETPTAPNPRLNGGVSASVSDTTLRFTNPPLDKDGAVVTFGFILGVTNKDGYTERCYVPAGALSADGLTATGVVRGLNPTGSDYTTGSANFAAKLDGNSKVFCAVDTTYYYMMQEAIQGVIATGGTELVVGAETDVDMYFSVKDASGKQQLFRKEFSTGNAQYSDDGGSSWNNIAGAVAGQLLVITGADTTPGNANAKILAGDGLDAAVGSPGGNETLTFSVDVTDFIDTAAGLTETGNNIQVNLGNGVEFNAGAIQAKAGSGVTVDATGINVSNLRTSSGVAYETLLEGDAVAKLPIEVKWRDQLDDANEIDLGDANARWKYALKFTATKDETINDRILRLKKNGTATQTITVSIQADSSGEPSGTALDSDTLAASSLTTSFASYTFNFGTGVSIVDGTDYWVVIEVDADDAANYVKVQVASAWDEQFVTAERLTFDLTGGTWGGSVTNAPFWCWGTETFGFGIVKANITYLNRAWSFEGFASAAASAGDAVNVYYDMTDVAQGVTITEGVTYYLGSAGQLKTTPETFSLEATDVVSASIKVGKGVLDQSGNVRLKLDVGEKRVFASQIEGAGTYSIPIWFENFWIRSRCAKQSAGSFDATPGLAIGDATLEQVSLYELAGNSPRQGYIWYQDATNNVAIADATDVGFDLVFTLSSATAAVYLDIVER